MKKLLLPIILFILVFFAAGCVAPHTSKESPNANITEKFANETTLSNTTNATAQAAMPSGPCTTLLSGDITYINESTVLCKDTYQDAGIIINSKNIKLDCNNSTLESASRSQGIMIAGDNAEIQNCVIKNYGTGIQVVGTKYAIVKNNIIINPKIMGIELRDAQDCVINENTINTSEDFTDILGINVLRSNFNTIQANTIIAHEGMDLIGSHNNNIISNQITARFGSEQSPGAGSGLLVQGKQNNLTNNIITGVKPATSTGYAIKNGILIEDILNLLDSNNISGADIAIKVTGKNNTLNNNYLENSYDSAVYIGRTADFCKGIANQIYGKSTYITIASSRYVFLNDTSVCSPKCFTVNITCPMSWDALQNWTKQNISISSSYSCEEYCPYCTFKPKN